MENKFITLLIKIQRTENVVGFLSIFKLHTDENHVIRSCSLF